MKTAVSIPDAIFEAADRLAKRLGMSRSELYARAVTRFVKDHRYEGVTERLDSVYAEDEARVDPALAWLQQASLPPEEW